MRPSRRCACHERSPSRARGPCAALAPPALLLAGCAEEVVWKAKRSALLLLEPVDLVDLVPILLELLEVPVPADLAGHGLVPTIRGNGRRDRPVFLEAGFSERSPRAVLRGPWKLVHLRSAEERERYRRSAWELYDLERDREEKHGVIARHPGVARELRGALEAYARTAAAPEGPQDVLGTRDLDPAVREQLRALGYLEEESGAGGSDARAP